MKKLLIIALILTGGCFNTNQKETIKKLKSKVKKEDVCKLIEVTNEIIKTFYPESKALFVSQTVQTLGCKDTIKTVKEIINKN